MKLPKTVFHNAVGGQTTKIKVFACKSSAILCGRNYFCSILCNFWLVCIWRWLYAAARRKRECEGIRKGWNLMDFKFGWQITKLNIIKYLIRNIYVEIIVKFGNIPRSEPNIIIREYEIDYRKFLEADNN